MKTFSHLSALNRMPTDYELLTTDLDYFRNKGSEIPLPVQKWADPYRCSFQCKDWNQFYDPRQTTYSSYTHLQKTNEEYVNRIFENLETKAFDKTISGEWLTILESVLPPLRYPLHGMQMASSYLGSLAPTCRITVVSLFQAADEVRCIQRVAYRMAQLRKFHPDFGSKSREAWEKSPPWQPFRELVERLLVTYDWAEAFVALNLVLKPIFSEVIFNYFSQVALNRKDFFLSQVLDNLAADAKWHQAWSFSLAQLLVSESTSNVDKMNQFIEKWGKNVLTSLNYVKSLRWDGFDSFLVDAFSSYCKDLEDVGLQGPKMPVGWGIKK